MTFMRCTCEVLKKDSKITSKSIKIIFTLTLLHVVSNKKQNKSFLYTIIIMLVILTII